MGGRRNINVGLNILHNHRLSVTYITLDNKSNIFPPFDMKTI